MFFRSTPLVVSSLLFAQTCLSQSNSNTSAFQGFNSGSTFPDYKAKHEDDFREEFETMQKLKNSPGVFNSVRLYTNVQPYTTSDPLSAIPAAIKTKTSMLLGIWTSGTNNITNELSALSAAIDKWGADLGKAVIGISVGSEDIFRSSQDGLAQNASVGASPKTIINFVKETREAIKGTVLENAPVGHVDTWSTWANKSNSDLVDVLDWLGVTIYPFFENQTNVAPKFLVNSPENNVAIFDDRYSKTLNASKGKPVWVTETGHPYESKGPAWGASVASVDQQKAFWRDVGCSELFGRVNTWWYTLRDANPTNVQEFGINDQKLSTTPRFDLTCPADSGAPATVNTSSAPDSGLGGAVVRALVVCVLVALVGY